MQYQQLTQGGYGLYDVISALQKEIRRGNEYAAFYWALELCPKYEAYMWRRLVVIANEDLGIAAGWILEFVPQQRAIYFELRAERGGNGSAKMVLANTILAMCRSPKCRMADEFKCVVEQDRRHGTRLEVPDYALDMHTATGKRKGRGHQFWLDEGCVLSPVADVENPYAAKAREYWLSGDLRPGKDWGTRTAKGAKESSVQTTLFDEDESEA